MNKKNKVKNLNSYLVGGAVRDELLGLSIKERDWVVVGATTEQLLSQGFKQVGNDFPVFLHPDTKEEYALARTEAKKGKGYLGFICDFSPKITLEEDLLRRDLTINAMAKDHEGNILDPYNGLEDLEKRILRHVSHAFVEDPLRVLRVARFMSRFSHIGFKVAPETLDLMQKIVKSGELQELTKERVWLEFYKSFCAKSPDSFILTLRECGALKVIFPELDRLWGVPQDPYWHSEIDTGVHIILTLKEISKLTDDPRVRFAVLCHDLGKGVTDLSCYPYHPKHEEDSAKLVNDWCKKYKVPNEYRQLAIKVARWHMVCHIVFDFSAKEILSLLKNLDAFRKPKDLDDFLLACIADTKHFFDKGLDPDNRVSKHCKGKYLQSQLLKEAFQVASKISGKKFLDQGMLPGKKLGDLIEKAQIDIIEKEVIKKFKED